MAVLELVPTAVWRVGTRAVAELASADVAGSDGDDLTLQADDTAALAAAAAASAEAAAVRVGVPTFDDDGLDASAMLPAGVV